MGFGNRPKVYMGRDGFRGVREIRPTSYLERYAGPQKKPKVYIGSGGVSAGRVLAAGGIARGGVVRVRSWEKPRAMMPTVKPKVVADIPKKDECVPPMDERGNGMKPEEKRLADLLEAAQEVKPKCEETARLADPPSEIPIEERAVLPELPLGDVPQTGKKKKRKRRSRKNPTAEEVPQPTAV